MRTFASILTLSTLALAGTAAAQDRPARAQGPDVSYDFEDDAIEAAPYRPDGVIVDVRGRALRTSLVRPRVHFVPELLKSVERL